MTATPRPKRFPPPEFPPRRPALFARTPPAVFPPILGLLALCGALRLALDQQALPLGLVDLLAGVAVALWLFATCAYGVKALRRPAVVVEDLRVLPGRSGLAAMTMGGMATATLLAVYAPGLAKGLIVLALLGHAVLAGLLARLLLSLPAEARVVNPTLHLGFVGFIVAAPAAVIVGWGGLALALFWLTLPVAVVIWALSAVQFARVVPPPPLRPLLAVHVAPAAVLSGVASLLGYDGFALVFAVLAGILAAALMLAGRWMMAAGPSPLWGALTFPLAALATAALRLDGAVWFGPVVLAVGLPVIPAIAWWVLRCWPGGKLAAMTNAAEA